MKDQSKNDENDDNDDNEDNDHDDHDDNDNDNDDNVDDRVEKTFQLLRDAKKFELEQKHWLATEKFVEAYQLLRILAEEENKKVADLATAAGTAAGTTATTATTTTAQNDDNNNNETGDDDNNDDGDNNDDDNSNTSEEEEKIKNIRQIAQLYTSKANEYWKQSRQCLIQAMEQEKKLDSNNKIDETNSMSDNDTATDACLFPCASSCTLLDDDQARIRNYNFSLLFSRPIVGSILPPVGVVEENTTTTTTIDDDEISPLEENPNNPTPTPTSLIDQQWSLEERLQNLNKTLPSSFKSTDERMSEVNKGLNKLGLSLYTQKEPFARFATEELPKSEEEQIDEIMNQATDEANVEDQIIINNNNQSTKEVEEDENFEDSDDDDDDDDEGDLLLDDDQLFMKSIQKKVVKAQIKLAELLAILNEARSIKAKEDDIDDDDDDDDDDKDSDDDSSFNDDITKPDLAFSLLTSKIKLKGAQRDMRKALAEFDNISM